MLWRTPSDQARPLLLPHFVWNGEALTCLLDERAPLILPAQQRALLARADGRQSIATLQSEYGVEASWWREFFELGLLVFLPEAGRAAPLGSRQRVCLLAAHHDDAALSLGGFLLAHRGQFDLTVVTLASQSHYSTSTRLFGQSDVVSALRAREEDIFARLVGAQRLDLGLVDALAREPGACELSAVFGEPSAQAQAEFVASVDAVLTKLEPDLLLLPLSVGDHKDHVALFRAGVSALTHSKVRPRVWFYEDLPYATAHYPELLARISRLNAYGAKLEPRFFDVTATLTEKLVAVSVYRSQPIQHFLEEVLRYARVCGAEGTVPFAFRERIWTLHGELDHDAVNTLAPEPPYQLPA